MRNGPYNVREIVSVFRQTTISGRCTEVPTVRGVHASGMTVAIKHQWQGSAETTQRLYVQN